MEIVGSCATASAVLSNACKLGLVALVVSVTLLLFLLVVVVIVPAVFLRSCVRRRDAREVRHLLLRLPPAVRTTDHERRPLSGPGGFKRDSSAASHAE